MKQETLCDAAPCDKDDSNLFISNTTKKSISDSHEPSTSTNNIHAEFHRPMRLPTSVQIFPRPEIDLAGPSKTFPPQTTSDIIRLMALQNAEKDKKKRSAENNLVFEFDNAIRNANKSAKGKKNPKGRDAQDCQPQKAKYK